MFVLRRYFWSNTFRNIQIIRKLQESDVKYIKTRNFCTDQTKSSEKEDSENSKSSSESRKNDIKNVPQLITSFENVSDKTKEAYLDMITIFEKRSVHRRNHVEFIYAALKNMEAFGVNRDIEVYKALINVMPKGKFIPTNMFQVEFMHYPKQQQCIIDLLEQMEDNGVIPDTEIEDMLLNVFGKRGFPLRKYWRMMYWMPKFKNLSPWPLPNPVPNEVLELAKLAINRMCTVDLQSIVSIYDTKELKDSIEETWIVSGMSPEQTKLLNAHDKKKPIYIEGPFLIWLRNRSINYFILRADPNPEELKQFLIEDDTDDVRKIKIPFFVTITKNKEDVKITKKRSVHQQDDGTIFAICATGTSSKDSLLSWIRLLQLHGNTVLSDIPILFKLKSKTSSNALVNISDNELKDIKIKR